MAYNNVFHPKSEEELIEYLEFINEHQNERRMKMNHILNHNKEISYKDCPDCKHKEDNNNQSDQ